MSENDIKKWYLKAELTDRAWVYAKGKQEQMPLEDDDDTPGCDLATYRTELGKENVQVLRWLQEDVRGEELKTRLMTLPLFEEHFNAFWENENRVAEKLDFATRCASMELCMNGKHACQVHLHSFKGAFVAPHCTDDDHKITCAWERTFKSLY